MGMAYPQYNLDQSVIDLVLNLIEEVKAKNFANATAEISHRPLRPEELNQSLNVNTRIYNTTITSDAEKLLLGGTTEPVVKTGSVYLIYGWIHVPDESKPFLASSIARIKVEGVVRNEVAPALVAIQENCAMLTLDQVVILTEQTTFGIYVQDVSNSGGGAVTETGLLYPLGVRIGPTAQLSVS